MKELTAPKKAKKEQAKKFQNQKNPNAGKNGGNKWKNSGQKGNNQSGNWSKGNQSSQPRSAGNGYSNHNQTQKGNSYRIFNSFIPLFQLDSFTAVCMAMAVPIRGSNVT